MNSGEIVADFPGVALTEDADQADVVVLGGAGPEFTYDRLNEVLRLVIAGVPLVAMHRGLTWRTASGLQLDTGAFLVAVEAASGVRGVVVGKPASPFFLAALDLVDATVSQALMVGDDIEADVLGAQGIGMTGVLVRTGKFRAETLANVVGVPDYVIDSFADLPALLGLE